MTSTYSLGALSSASSVRHGLLSWLLAILAVASNAPAGATPVTYTLTALGVNGNVGNTGSTGSLSNAVTGGTSFTGATLTMQLAGDTSDVTGSNGSTARLGSLSSVTGDRISFTLSGGGLPSTVSGTMLASDGWTFQSGTPPQGQGNYVFFTQSGSQFVFASFMRPGASSSPVPTYDYMVTNSAFSVTSRTAPGGPELEDPPGSGNYVGGSTFPNWDTVTPGVYTMVGTTVGGLYFTNGSNDYFNGSFDVLVVPEPNTLALATFAGVGVCTAGWRRRRK